MVSSTSGSIQSPLCYFKMILWLFHGYYLEWTQWAVIGSTWGVAHHIICLKAFNQSKTHSHQQKAWNRLHLTTRFVNQWKNVAVELSSLEKLADNCQIKHLLLINNPNKHFWYCGFEVYTGSISWCLGLPPMLQDIFCFLSLKCMYSTQYTFPRNKIITPVMIMSSDTRFESAKSSCNLLNIIMNQFGLHWRININIWCFLIALLINA